MLRRLPLAAAAYVAFPADLISDHLGLVGRIDDVAVAALAVAAMIGLVPKALKQRHRSEAALIVSRRIWALPRAPQQPAPVAAVSGRLRAAWTRILSGLGGPGYVTDKDLRIVSASPAAFATWGKAPQDVLGRPLLEVFPAVANGEGYKALLQAARTARPVRLNTVSVLLGRPVNVSVRPLGEGLRVRFRLAA
jgi:uncharacterized membrane protein YkvA (DUF1232 family)